MDFDGPKEACIGWVAQIPHAKGQLLGERTCPGMRGDTDMSCAQMAEPIDLLFGLWTLVCRRKHKFSRICQVSPIMGGHIDATWQIHLNRPSAVAMQPFVKLLWPLVDFVVVCTGLHLG